MIDKQEGCPIDIKWDNFFADTELLKKKNLNFETKKKLMVSKIIRGSFLSFIMF
jgi:hypothetical protein